MTNVLVTAAVAAVLAGCKVKVGPPAGPDAAPVCDAGPAPLPADGGCRVPDGTYRLILEPLSGQCPDDLVADPGASWFAGPDELRLFGAACGPIESSLATEDPERGCRLTLTYTVTGSGAGLTGGAAILDADCEDGTACRHIFEVVVVGCGPA